MSAIASWSCEPGAVPRRRDVKKNILVIAKRDKTEALRMAAGLTLLDDVVKVAVLGSLEGTPAVQEQIEVLEFAEVPVTRYRHWAADPRALRPEPDSR
jgi:hypothetical protein